MVTAFRMMRVTLALGWAAASALAQGPEEAAPGVRCTEWKREAAAAAVRRLAILPPVVVLRFDVGGRLPSPDRFTIRRAVASELAPALREKLQPRYQVALNESVAAVLAEEGLLPVDIYQTARGAEETLRDQRGNLCTLRMARSALEADPLAATVYHYRPAAIAGIARDDVGLAVVRRDTTPLVNSETVKRIASRLRADAFLLLRVEDLDTKEGKVGILLQDYKSSWITLRATLISAEDARVLWDATLQGHSSTRERKIPFSQYSKGYNKAEDRLALDGMTKILPVLVERLAGG